MRTWIEFLLIWQRETRRWRGGANWRLLLIDCVRHWRLGKSRRLQHLAIRYGNLNRLHFTRSR